MSINCTSINDSTSHRHIHDEPSEKQYQTNKKSTKSKKSKKNHTSSSSSSTSHEECDIIGEIIGKYGKYQFYMTFLLSLFQIPNTFHISSPIYQVSVFMCMCVYLR